MTILNDIQTAFNDQSPFVQFLGMHVESIDATHGVVTLDMKEELIGNYGYEILHGGAIASVMDTAMGIVAIATSISQLGDDFTPDKARECAKRVGTIDMRVDFLRPGKGEHFVARSTLIHASSQFATLECTLVNHADELIATAVGKFKI